MLLSSTGTPVAGSPCYFHIQGSSRTVGIAVLKSTYIPRGEENREASHVASAPIIPLPGSTSRPFLPSGLLLRSALRIPMAILIDDKPGRQYKVSRLAGKIGRHISSSRQHGPLNPLSPLRHALLCHCAESRALDQRWTFNMYGLRRQVERHG